MPDPRDFLPVISESIEDIRGRIDADANLGVAAGDDDFVDTTEGHFWHDATQAPGLEIDRLYDFLSVEVPSVMFPALTFGEWLDEHGVTLDLPRKDEVKATGTVTFAGTAATPIPSGTQVSAPPPDPDSDPVAYATTAPATIPGGGSVDVAVEAILAGPAGNQPAGSVAILDSGIGGVSAVSNALAMSGGAEVETDDRYSDRIIREYSANRGGGTVADYEAWALGYEPIGSVSVEPLWAGAGTVRVVVADQDNNPVSGTVVAGLQTLLDPVPGEGRGLAPIGAAVTVATVTSLTVNVAATVTLRAGFILSDVSADVVRVVSEYIDGLKPGDDVVAEHAKAQIFQVPGIYDVAALVLNGGFGNLAVAGTQIAQTGTVTVA